MDILAEAVARHEKRTALDDGARSWTYRELDEEVDGLAARLHAAGARPGTAVAILLHPGARAVCAIHAVARLGAVLAPLSPQLTRTERADALEALGPAVVLDRRGPEPGPGGWKSPGQDVGAVLWTSGSAGAARGVLISREALRHSAAAVGARLGLGADDRWYASLSVAHIGGLALVTRAAVHGSCVVARGRFRVDGMNELVDAGSVTHVSLVPTMLHHALAAREDRPPPPSLRCVLVGGAHTPAVLLDRALAAGFPVALTYGLTEATSQVATAAPDLVARKRGTVGPPLDGVEVRVGRHGELLVRGPTVALGRLGDHRLVVDEEGWLYTGDRGTVDDEGHVYVTGRRSHRIVTGGVTVDPAEVEEVLRQRPGIEDVAVVGLPDAEWGELLVAVVIRRAGSALDEAELDAATRERLSSPKVPRRFIFVDSLPRNANGKLDRARLSELIRQG